MILYHFCPIHMFDRIRKQGLTLGKLALPGDGHITFVDGFQWLTNDPDPTKQSWATKIFISYSRTDCRLTVDVPNKKRGRLFKATELVNTLEPEYRQIVDSWPGSEHWYVYKGRIPPNRIVKSEILPNGV